MFICCILVTTERRTKTSGGNVAYQNLGRLNRPLFVAHSQVPPLHQNLQAFFSFRILRTAILCITYDSTVVFYVLCCGHILTVQHLSFLIKTAVSIRTVFLVSTVQIKQKTSLNTKFNSRNEQN